MRFFGRRSENDTMSESSQLTTDGSNDNYMSCVSRPHKTSTSNPYTFNDRMNNMGFGLGTIFFLIGPALFFAFEGAELMIQSEISYIVACEWHKSAVEVFIIEIMTMLGIFTGSWVISSICHNSGRRNTLIVIETGLVIFTTLSAMAVSIIPYTIFQFGVGFFIGGGIPQVIMVLIEVVPEKWAVYAFALRAGVRASGLLYGLALSAVFPHVGLSWFHVILGINLLNIPALIAVCLSDDSPRYHFANGNDEKALEVLESIEELNNVSLTSCFKRKVELVDNSEKDTVSGDTLDVQPTKDMENGVGPEVKGVQNGNGPAIMDLQNDNGHAIMNLQNDNGHAIVCVQNGNGHIPAMDRLILDGDISSPELTPQLSSVMKPEDDPEPREELLSSHAVFNLVLMALYGFAVQGLYYGLVFYEPLLIRDQFCTATKGIVDSILPDICSKKIDESVGIRVVSNLISPLGAVLAAISAIFLGRKPTGMVVSVLFFLTTCYFYSCPSDNPNPMMFEIVCQVLGLLKCAGDLLAYLIAVEYFPTVEGTLGLSTCVSGAKLGATTSIIICQYGYLNNEWAVAGYLQVLCILMFVVVCLTSETKNNQHSSER